MAIKIPQTFNVHKQALDPLETAIRDGLKLNIENWARFRYTINVGNTSKNLYSNTSIPSHVEDAYRELAKTHYEVITSLGYIKLAQLDLYRFHTLSYPPLRLQKSLKDFYFHIGSLLDNLARLIYIINDPDSAYEKKGKDYLRHWVDWGSLRDYKGYTRMRKSKKIYEIINIRNRIAHSWKCPLKIEDKTIKWPLAARRSKNYLWFYDENEILKQKYRKWINLFAMVQEDFDFVEVFQNRIFGKLVRDIKIFENNNNVEIR